MSPPGEHPRRGPVVSATFHLTHNCNLRCSYCFTGEKFGRGMTEETAEQGVEFAIAEAHRQEAAELEVVFFGGEPLLRHDLLCSITDQVLEKAGDLPVSFKVSTNGTLLTEEVVHDLASRGVFVSISLDGDPETQDRQRPDAHGHGSSGRLREGLERLLSWNPCANVTCVVIPESAGVLDRSVRWLFDRGFRYITTTLDYSAEWRREHLDTLEASYQRLADWAIERSESGERFYLSCFDAKIRARAYRPPNGRERCSLGFGQFSIAPSGTLYPCVQFVTEDRDETHAIGDVRTGFTALRGELHARSEREKDDCTGCAHLGRCSSWCACVNWRTTGHVDQVSGFVCEHERVLLPIADRVANRLWNRRNPQFLHKNYNPAFPVLSFLEDLTIRELP